MSFKSVLMIDDDEFTIDLQKMLISLHHLEKHVYFENSGKNAIQTLEKLIQTEQFPSHILLDINMPDMSGFEFLDVFQNQFNVVRDTTKIFVITSSFRDADRKTALSHPMVSDYLVKPLPNDFIVKLVMS